MTMKDDSFTKWLQVLKGRLTVGCFMILIAPIFFAGWFFGFQNHVSREPEPVTVTIRPTDMDAVYLSIDDKLDVIIEDIEIIQTDLEVINEDID